MAGLPEVEGYDELTRVAHGGFGIVYRARQQRHHRTVALKVLQVEELDERARLRFDRECKAMGSLSWHPNVVALLDSGVTVEGQPYLAMEYLDGGSLGDRLRDGSMTWEESVSAGIQVAGALGAAHDAGILHRDIKPENLLVGPFGEVKLGDFGIAAVEGGRTTTGHASFTVNHVAPETLRGQQPDERSDVYALGSTVYTLIAGAPPYAGPGTEPIASQMMRVLEAPVPRLETVPKPLADLLERALRKDPRSRPQTAESFGRALQDVETEMGVRTTDLRLAPVARSAPSRVPVPAADALETTTSDDAVAESTISTPRVALPGLSDELPDVPPVPGGSGVPPVPVSKGTEARLGGRRRPVILATVVGVVLVAVMATVIVTSGGDDSTGRDEGAETSRPTVEVAEAVPVGAEPQDVTTGGGALWVANKSDGTVSRLDPDTGEVAATIPVGLRPNGLAVTGDGAWVANSGDATVSRIDLATDTVVETILVGLTPTSVGVTDEAIWVTNYDEGDLSRIDPATNAVTDTIPLGRVPGEIAATSDSLWVTNPADGTVTQVDPNTNGVLDTVPVGESPGGIAVTTTDVWVTNIDDDTVSRIDTGTNEVIETISVGRAPGSIAASESDVWVTNFDDDTVSRIDPTTNEVTETVAVGALPNSVTVAGTGTVWVANAGDDTINRIGT